MIESMTVWDWAFIAFMVTCVQVLVPLMGNRGARRRRSRNDDEAGRG